MRGTVPAVAAREAEVAKGRNAPVLGRCPTCEHEWPVCYLPMPIEQAGRLMRRAECPKGCTASPVMGGR